MFHVFLLILINLTVEQFLRPATETLRAVYMPLVLKDTSAEKRPAEDAESSSFTDLTYVVLVNS